MLRRLLMPSVLRPRTGPSQLARSCYSIPSKVSDPLRILFCGSDEFSCESLRALDAEQKSNPTFIRSIDVVVRPPKPTGRGYKQVREGPLRLLAKKLSLPIHDRDTFTGWHMPQPGGEAINLIIAVSFGRFVPPRLLQAARYGGLNIHPSLLPDLRGPAPLHHAILQGRNHTGLSLQTLSAEDFDRGTILDQTPLPGIPIPPSCDLKGLSDPLASLGASMLINGLRANLHVPPYVPRGWTPSPQEQTLLTEAPKITSADRNFLAGDPDATVVFRRFRALGPLWTYATPNHVPSSTSPACYGPPHKRLKLEDIRTLPAGDDLDALLDQRPIPDRVRRVQFVTEERRQINPPFAAKISKFYTSVFILPEKGGSVAVRLPGGGYVTVGRITVEGQQSQPAAVALRDFGRHPSGDTSD